MGRVGQVYKCDHPLYDTCSLILSKDGKGLAIIQQYVKQKMTYWSSVEEQYLEQIYSNSKFQEFFDTHAGTSKNGLYPTITLRQLLWRLKIQPPQRQIWETYFVHTAML